MLEPMPTDEQLAADAQWLAAIAVELAAIAERWQRRFPIDSLVTRAVDQLIGSVQAFE